MMDIHITEETEAASLVGGITRGMSWDYWPQIMMRKNLKYYG